MKYPEIEVSIPEPCHEDWNQMTPTEKGKFCDVCTKEVIDFTSKSDEEIVKYVITNKNLCGRFHKTQLDRKLIVNRKKRNHWLSYVASLLFPMALFSQEVKNETTNIPKTEQTNSKNFKSLKIGSLNKQRKITTSIQNDSITVNGFIADDTGIPFLGVTVLVKGSNTKITTDFDGNFSIKVKKGAVLVVNYPGYKTKEIKVDKNKYDITLEQEDVLEDLFINGGYGVHKTLSGVAGLAVTVNADNIKVDKKKARQEKRERRRAKRAERKAARAAKKDDPKS